GWKNQWLGKKVTVAKTRRARRTRFVSAPSENRGGRASRQTARTIMTMPSSHFGVDPPRKQASTGSNATVALAIQRVMATFWVLTRSRSIHANLASAPGKPSEYGNRPDLTREPGERYLPSVGENPKSQMWLFP